MRGSPARGQPPRGEGRDPPLKGTEFGKVETFDVGSMFASTQSDAPRNGRMAGVALIKPKAFYIDKIMPGWRSSFKAARDAKLKSFRDGAYFPQSRHQQ